MVWGANCNGFLDPPQRHPGLNAKCLFRGADNNKCFQIAAMQQTYRMPTLSVRLRDYKTTGATRLQIISFTAWWPHKGASGLSLGSPSCDCSFDRRALMVSHLVINTSHTNLHIQGGQTYMIHESDAKRIPTTMYCWDPPSTPALQNPSGWYNSKRLVSSSIFVDCGVTFLRSCFGGAGRGI